MTRSVVRPGPTSGADETCAHPWCSKPLVIPATGRRPVYCSERCRKHAHALRRQDEARAAAAEAQRAEARRHEGELRDAIWDLITLLPKRRVDDILNEWVRAAPLWDDVVGQREAMVHSLASFVRSRGTARRRRDGTP